MDRRSFLSATAAAPAAAPAAAAISAAIGCAGAIGLDYRDPITPLPGRRVSCREGDPGFDRLAHFCTVYLDGKQVEACYTADERLGEVHCFSFTADGPMTVVRRGVVRIEGPDNG